MSTVTVTDGAGRADLVFDRLHPRLGMRITRSAALRDQHSRGEGVPDVGLPDLVAFPLDNQDVAAIAAACTEFRLPIIPFGTGTSLEGHVAALQGGVCVDLSRMDRILSISAEAMDCRVQAGVTRETLNASLRSSGLFFPVDPGADASLGGMAATRASGTAAVRYGTMRENVLGLTVVTPDGRIITTGTRARKSASGLDLTRLYVGSEGVLGLITEVQLKLYGLPEATVAAVCQFPSLDAAMATVIAVLQAGVPIARIELANAMQMHMVIRYSGLHEFADAPTLFLEFHGSEQATREQAEFVQELATEMGGGGFAIASLPEDRTRLWKARHSNYYANLHYQPGKSVMGTDACVPISALVDCIAETEADVAASGLLAPLIGHVGDGNFHLGIIFDPTDPAERARAEGLARRVGERAIRLGGTCSGEHGIGMHKRGLAALEHGQSAGVMWAIKHALDPAGIMNPGKLLPSHGDSV
jgi:D-lactate dehydrogenase (cytochrome)